MEQRYYIQNCPVDEKNELNYQDHLALENVICVGELLVVENKR